MYVREAHITPAEAERQAFVIDAQEVEQGGVQVVDLDAILDHLVAPFVGLAIAEAALTPPPAIQMVNPYWL